jgi:hypothetical protein
MGLRPAEPLDDATPLHGPLCQPSAVLTATTSRGQPRQDPELWADDASRRDSSRQRQVSLGVTRAEQRLWRSHSDLCPVPRIVGDAAGKLAAVSLSAWWKPLRWTAGGRTPLDGASRGGMGQPAARVVIRQNVTWQHSPAPRNMIAHSLVMRRSRYLACTHRTHNLRRPQERRIGLEVGSSQPQAAKSLGGHPGDFSGTFTPAPGTFRGLSAA